MNWLIHRLPAWIREKIYSYRLKEDRSIYDGNPIPKNLDEAVAYLIAHQPPESLEYIRNSKNSSHNEHFTVGMNIRNDWGLWENSVLAQWFKTELGLGHPDDMSGMILSALWAKVRGEFFGVKTEANWYKEYWKKMGIDPLTQQQIGPSPKKFTVDPKTGDITDVEY